MSEFDPKRQMREAAKLDRSERSIDHAAHCVHIGDFLNRHVPVEKRVLVFDAIPGEVDLGALIADHPEPQARFGVTRTPDESFDLTLHPYGGKTEMHRYGFEQPTVDSPQFSIEALGAVLVPGLAFDKSGGRLGRGRGYYDRLLVQLTGIPLVGVTGDYLVDLVPNEPHDVPMTHFATSSGVYVVGSPLGS